ncbi:MAG: hypothetical protein WAV41_05285 [Microgenomates group bacterium]
MQNFDELSTQLKLTPVQKSSVEKFFGQMIIELLESIKQDNVQNFDETINSIKNSK